MTDVISNYPTRVKAPPGENVLYTNAKKDMQNLSNNLLQFN